MAQAPFPRLARPPIDEVVCGILFRSLPAFTPAVHGAYWVERLKDFPKTESQIPLVDEIPEAVQVNLEAPPIRTWLVSEDESRLLQLQHDRFFVNWRRRQTAPTYPRFSGVSGLRAFALSEFEAFSKFLLKHKFQPEVQQAEVTKIDVLSQGTEWKDFDDLHRLLPWTSYSLGLRVSDAPAIALRFEDKLSDGIRVRVSAASGIHRHTKVQVVRLETSARMAATADALPAALDRMNSVVNETFFKLIPPEEMRRFGVEAA